MYIRGPTNERVLPVKAALLVVAAVLAGCVPAPRHGLEPGAAFFAAIRPHCGQAYAGRLLEGTAPGDAAIGAERLVMHVRDCTESEVRIPFHVGANRSRTWIVSRRDGELLLKHDHRHEDGSADRITQYGGATRDGAGTTRLEFFADAETAALIPTARGAPTASARQAVGRDRRDAATLRQAPLGYRLGSCCAAAALGQSAPAPVIGVVGSEAETSVVTEAPSTPVRPCRARNASVPAATSSARTITPLMVHIMSQRPRSAARELALRFMSFLLRFMR